jgi:antitoxin HicB
MDKTIDYYMGLPYTIEMVPGLESGWVVSVRELPGCISQGDSPQNAVDMIREAMCGWLEIALEDGLSIPEPRELEQYSGKFVVRVPRWLHRELVRTTDQEGVSLNQFVSTALARAVGEHSASVERAVTQASAASVTAARQEPALPRPRKPRKDERKQPMPSRSATYVISPQTTAVCLADSDPDRPATDAAPVGPAGE